MGKPSTTLKVDRDAREVFNEAAIAAGMGDRELALEVCKKLAEVEKAYELRLRVGEEHAREHGAFVGRPMHAKYPGRCAVCSQGISEGAPIVYNSELRQAAHAGCAGSE